MTDAAALAWRLERHGLGTVSASSVVDAADRMIAVRGWPLECAELATAVRRTDSHSSAMNEALASGELIRSYAFRGGSYVFSPTIAATVLAVRTTSRAWEKVRFQRQGDFVLDDWEPFRQAIREMLSDGPLTRQQITAELARTPSLAHLRDGATGAGADSLYKPLHWWGDICFGPSRDGQTTFRLLAGDPQWPGLPDVDEAGRQAIRQYLAAYGPMTLANLDYWLVEGLSAPRRQVRGWLADLDDELARVNTDEGTEAYLLAADVAQVDSCEPSETVRLLPGFDPWVLGPGSADTRVVPATHRAVVSRGSNLVIRGGVVSGTWRIRKDSLEATWLATGGRVPVDLLNEEAQRMSGLAGRALSLQLAD